MAGDFNGDGRTDLAVANAASDDVSVLLGNGDGTFQDQARYAAGHGPYAIVAGDFNGDGRTDLAVANYADNDVSVLLGNGDGTFQDQMTYRVGTEPVRPRGGRLQRRRPHRPGRRQLRLQRRVGVAGQRRRHLPGPGARTRWGPGQTRSWRGTSTATAAPTWPSPTTRDNDVSVLLGNGDGTFQNQVRYAVGTDPTAVVAGDFNGDGRTDLAVANAGSGDVSVLLGNGDGTFQNQVRYAVGYRPSALVAGDFNGDGRTDLAVANSAPTTCRCCWATATAPSRTR